MAITGASVSAYLHRAGYHPVAPDDHAREGLRCRSQRNGTDVFVVADLDHHAAAVRLMDQVADTLRAGGYVVDRDGGEMFAYVSRAI